MEPHDDIAIFKALLRSVGNQFWKNGNTASTIEMNGWKGHDCNWVFEQKFCFDR